MVLQRFFPVVLLFVCPGCLTDLARHSTVADTNPLTPAPLPSVAPVVEPNPVVVRSQSPPTAPTQPIIPATLLTPSTVPLTRITPDEATRERTEPTEPQVRIVATIGVTPIYDQEVREAVYQRNRELLEYSPTERKAKEKDMYFQELKRIIERELILDEMFARLKSQKRTSSIEELEKISAKDADTRMKDIRKRLKIPNDREFKNFMTTQGLTAEGLHRHFARGTMMNIFMTEVIKPKVKSISLSDLKDYYDDHSDQFELKDCVKWQDMVLLKSRLFDTFKNPEDGRKYCESLAERARKGENFVKLVQQFDHRALPPDGGMGLGEEKGKIFPPEIEPTVFELKQGDVKVVELDAGFHIVRIQERSYSGKRPFTDMKLQHEIRSQIEKTIGEREYRKLVESLWTKAQPTILIDVAK